MQLICPCCEPSKVNIKQAVYVARNQKYISDHLEAIDEALKEKFTPRGASRPLSPVPEEIKITEAQIDQAIEFFEGLFDREEIEAIMNIAGILLAEPIGEKLAGDTGEHKPLYYGEDKGEADKNWQWIYGEKRYYNEKEDRYLTKDEMDDTSITLIEGILLGMHAKTVALILQEITIQRWLKLMRLDIQDGHMMQFMFGVGGKNTLDSRDVGGFKGFVKSQWNFLQGFGEKIKEGDMSGAEALARAQLYGESTTTAYEKGKAKASNVDLPEYPADGNQDCFTNCRCKWIIEDDPTNEEYAICEWKLNRRAEHCGACLENARVWSTLRILKGVSYEDQELELEEEDTEPFDLDELEVEDDELVDLDDA